MLEFLKDTSVDLVPLFLAFIVYLLGLRAYYLQREYELVRRRYLDDGLDAFAADVEHALSVFQHNWHHSLTILKYYRELDASMQKDLLDKHVNIDMSQFRVRPNYRVGQLVGDNIFWEVQQLLFAFVVSSTSFFKDDLSGAVRHAISGGTLKVSKDEMIETYVSKCKKLMDETIKYHAILSEAQNVTTEFEKQRFSLKKVHNFKNRDEVKEILRRLKSTFSDKLKKYESS